MTVVTLASETVILTNELPGRISPFLIAEIRPQVSGVVKEVLFKEGSVVKAGQPLYQLDDASYRAESTSARASLVRAEATLKSAELTAQRSAELAKVDAVSRQDNEDAIAALRRAEADITVARAALDASNLVVGYARITSPIAGRIGKSTVTQGALVNANQAAALATVQDLDPVYVDLTQSSSELLKLRRALAAGTLVLPDEVPVTVLLEDGGPYNHEGKLAFTEVTVDPATGSYSLRAVVDNPQHILLPGMYVRAVIGGAQMADALLVPQQAIARDAKGNTSAMVVGKDGKVEVRTVRTLRTVGDKWLIQGGLLPGDKVIVEGLQRIRPGIDVQAEEAAAPAAAAAAPSPAAANPAAPAAAAPRQ